MKNNQQKVASTRIFKSKFAQFTSAKNWSKKKKQVKNHPKLHQNRDHLRKHHLSFQIEFAIKFYPPKKKWVPFKWSKTHQQQQPGTQMTLVFDWKFDLVLEASTRKIKDKQLPGRKVSPSSASAAHTAAGFLRRSNFGAAAAAAFDVDGSLVDGAPSVLPLPSKRVSQASLWRCTAWGIKQRVRIFWGQKSEMFPPQKMGVLTAKTFAFWK